ncbi:MAG TPA: hypothetical protein VEW08_17355 [Steroidobacteraceae bacterium]|nr:hypothetical protein [Steroidobacteraceae bacterium]
MIRAILCYVALALLSAGSFASPPKPAESEYFVTREADIFIVGGKGLCYTLSIELRKPLAAPIYITVDFEDPADRDHPFFVEREVMPGEHVVQVLSEPFRAIKNGGKYLVKVWIYEDALRRKPLGIHEQMVQFKVPGVVFNTFGIEKL